jgi:hypothetical protein
MNTPVHRTIVSQTLGSLTPQQVLDLCEFEHVKKWIPDLFALRFDIDRSTANRRLNRLVKIDALAKRKGYPLPKGGREDDIYYLSLLGARLVTKLRQRGANYVEAPNIANPIDNLHDLTVLEITLRAECYWQARFFQRQVFQVGGRDIVVIPDADFLSPYKSDRFFLEVEQTAKFEHILEKYQKYTQIFSTLSEEVTPWLVIGFPDFETFNQLIADHRQAANSVAAGRPLNLYYSLCSELHNQDCKTFEDIRHLDERGDLKTDAYGSKSHLTKLLD